MAQDFRVDLRAMVELLARHVYSSPRVFVRELLQNGVDAVTARRLVDPDAPHGPVRLQPADAGGDGCLVVTDPGIGLTLDEVGELLATIGGSSKRDELDLPREGFLGRFGIGLLSCFVVADRIEVLTRSCTGAPPVRFVGHDDGTYDVEELVEDDARIPQVGTVVRLAPRPGTASWIDAETVTRLARTFGVALPVPVVVAQPDGTEEAVTDDDLPWIGAATGAGRGRRSGQAAWCERELGFTPMAVVPIHAPSADAEGVAFVLPHEAHPGTGAGHRTYLRRMLLGDDVTGLLPDWAFFVRCVIDVGELAPTASRESLVDDDALALARSEFGAGLREWLLRLGTTHPDELDAILGVHGRAAKGLAAHDDEVWAALGPWLRFVTSAGALTAPEIVRRAGTVRYASTVDRFRQLAPIAAAQGLVVVNAGYTYDEELLARVEVAVPGAVSRALEDVDVVATLDDVTADRTAWAATFAALAREVLADAGCDVELRQFDPDVVPAMLLHDEEAQQRRRQRRTAEQVDDEWAGLLAELDDGGSDRPLLVFNDRHALVARLVDAAMTEPRVVGPAVQALYVQALLLGHHPLRGADLALMSRALLELVDGAVGRTDREGDDHG